MKSEKYNYFINKYKILFRQFAEEPPADIFENISDTLDINDVWEGVSATLDRKDKIKHFKKITRYIVVSLLLLISIGEILLVTNYNFKKYFTNDKKVINTKNETPDNPILIHPTKKNYISSILNTGGGNINDNHTVPNEEKNDLKKEQMESNLIIATFNKNKSETTNNVAGQGILGNNNNNDIKLSYIKPIQILKIDGVNKKDNLSLENNFSIDNILITESSVQKHSFLPRGCYFGISISLNNIWLLNHDTYKGLKKNELDITNLTMGESYGLLGGYNFSDKWCGQVDWFIHAERGQKYTIFREGKQYVKNIHLNYMQWNVVGKYKRINIGQFINTNPISLNIVAGPYFSILQTTGENYYSKNDYGFHLDYEYELYLKKFIFSLALQGDFGLKNIFTGTEIIPSYFNKTDNLALGVNMGIKYFISKK